MKAYTEECPSWSFPSEYEGEHRFVIGEFVKPDRKFGMFLRRHGILIILAAALILWTWTVHKISYHNGYEDASAEAEVLVAEAVQKTKDEIAASRFVADEESKTLQMEYEARQISKAMDGIKGITEREDDLRTYAWAIMFRVSNSGYPNSVQEVVSQPNQFMGFSDSNPVVTAKYRVAYEVVKDFYAGNWPTTDKFVYAEWDAKGKIILRDTYLSERQTEYWWWNK